MLFAHTIDADLTRIKPFADAGGCIYCTAAGDSIEHIIPRGLGGTLELPGASCGKCRDITTKFETRCIDEMFAATRPRFGIKGRKSKQVATRLPLRPASTGLETTRVPVAQHPNVIGIPTWRKPGILAGSPPDKATPAVLKVFPVADEPGNNWAQRMAAFGGGMVLPHMNLDNFSLMLAKIAHAYTVANLGREGFIPLLVPTIRGETKDAFTHYIGNLIREQPPTPNLHEIGLLKLAKPDYTEFWACRIRLFSNVKHSPTYDVISGQPL